MALGKRASRWRKRAWRGAIVKVARGNTKDSVRVFSGYYFFIVFISNAAKSENIEKTFIIREVLRLTDLIPY